MRIIQWDSKYEVNVRKIDRQHREIVDILNRLYALQEADTNRKEKPMALINLFNFVWDWFANHILTVDKKCMIKEGSAR